VLTDQGVVIKGQDIHVMLELTKEVLRIQHKLSHRVAKSDGTIVLVISIFVRVF
jgi:hypothetical protein